RRRLVRGGAPPLPRGRGRARASPPGRADRAPHERGRLGAGGRARARPDAGGSRRRAGRRAAGLARVLLTRRALSVLRPARGARRVLPALRRPSRTGPRCRGGGRRVGPPAGMSGGDRRGGRARGLRRYRRVPQVLNAGEHGEPHVTATMAEAVGLDVGGTKIAGLRVSRDGRILARRTVPTPASDPEATVAEMVRLASELRNRQVVAVGVGAAGMVDVSAGVLRYAPNLAWRELAIAERLRDALALPCQVDNDANAAAWGEFRFGAGRGYRHMLLVTVG